MKETLETYIDSGKFFLQRHVGSARSNEISVKKGKWTLQSDSEDLPAPVVNFTGLYGSHVFHENGCTSTILEVQMLNIIQHRAGEDARKDFGVDVAENVLTSCNTIGKAMYMFLYICIYVYIYIYIYIYTFLLTFRYIFT